MLLVFSFCHKDVDLALANAQWMSGLEIAKHHEALMVCNIECLEKGLQEPVYQELKKTFSVVHVAQCTEDERHWPEEQRKWPWVQNLSFTSAARHVRDHLRVPWLFLEADAFPLREGWLDEIEGEYHLQKKPFMGQLVATADPSNGSRIPEHMSGIAVYPADLGRHHDSALQGGGIAFDMVLRDATVAAMHDTKLIHHVYGTPTFATQGDLRRIRKGAVIFHQCKDLSLLDRLREARGLPLSIPSAANKTISTGVSAPANSRPMTTDILLKTYPGDYAWAQHVLRSIDKFCSGFRQVIIVTTDANGSWGVHAHPTTIKVEPDVEPGYMHQQVVKLHADRYSDADQFLTIDSDCVFTRPITPETFVRDGKIIWLKTPMGQSGGEVWMESMRAWYGATPQFEYMRRHPFLLPKWFLEEMRKFTQFMHGVSLSDYIMQAGQFSEFNCAGLLAEAKFKDRFLFLDTTKDEIPPACVRQWHSHDGVDSALEEIEAILGGPNNQPGGGGASPPEFAGSHSVKKHPESPGAEEQNPAPNPVSFAIATLAAEAQKSGLHKARMVAALVKAGLIEAKAKKPKRRMARA